MILEINNNKISENKMKPKTENQNFFGIKNENNNNQTKIQYFFHTKVIIKSPIPKNEFLNNMNKALSDINLESDENYLTLTKIDDKFNTTIYSNEPMFSTNFNPDPYSRISSFQL